MRTGMQTKTSWLTVTVGKYGTTKQILEALEETGIKRCVGFDKDILGNIILEEQQRDISLVRFTKEELFRLSRISNEEEFQSHMTNPGLSFLSKLIEIASLYGCEPCPLETAMAIALAYPDIEQGNNVSLNVVSHPFTYTDSYSGNMEIQENILNLSRHLHTFEQKKSATKLGLYPTHGFFTPEAYHRDYWIFQKSA